MPSAVSNISSLSDRLIASAIEQGLIESESDIKPAEMGENDGENAQKYPKMGKNAHFPTLAIKNILELLRQNPKIRYIDLQENLGIDDNTVHRSIAWLKDNGYINKEHSKVKGFWQLIK